MSKTPHGARYILALDQGTTSSRAIIFDHEANVVAVAQREFKQYFPHPAWVEHDPKEILSTQFAVVTEVLTKAQLKASDIEGIGITNQRETTVVWDKTTGEPVYNAIVWQCRRTAEMIDAMKAAGALDDIQTKTGLVPDAYFSASKIAWILENVAGARERAERGELLFGTIDTWLLWNLTSGKVHATDHTNASRTMLYNIHDHTWDSELCATFGIPMSMLPEVRPSSCFFGETSTDFLGTALPVAGIAGDQQAALFGQQCHVPGSAKNTYGTGCFLLMNTGDTAVTSACGLLTTVAAGLDDAPPYALEGSIFTAGAAIQWLRDELHIVSSAAETERLATSVPDTTGVHVVPAFTGLGAPWWDQDARGLISGITRGTNRAHIVRATLESLAYQTFDVVHAMEQDSGIDLMSLNVDGGAANNNFLMQFQADVLDTRVIRPEVTETTALGAAMLAGLAVGVWDSLEALPAPKRTRTFDSRMGSRTRTELLTAWHTALKRASSSIA